MCGTRLQMFTACSSFVMIAQKQFRIDLHSLTGNAAISFGFLTDFYLQDVIMFFLAICFSIFFSTTVLTACFMSTRGIQCFVHTLESRPMIREQIGCDFAHYIEVGAPKHYSTLLRFPFGIPVSYFRTTYPFHFIAMIAEQQSRHGLLRDSSSTSSL